MSPPSKDLFRPAHLIAPWSPICSWSIFLIGIGGIFAVMAMRKFGRLPVLFWSQVRAPSGSPLSHFSPFIQILALVFLVGCTFAPDLSTFAGVFFALNASTNTDITVFSYALFDCILRVGHILQLSHLPSSKIFPEQHPKLLFVWAAPVFRQILTFSCRVFSW